MLKRKTIKYKIFSPENKLRNVASCWLHSANILVMYGPMNVKKNLMMVSSFFRCHTCVNNYFPGSIYALITTTLTFQLIWSSSD